MAEKKHVIEYIDIIKAFEKVKEKLKNKSNKGHQHGNADITDIDASKIKSGTIDIDRLPKGAIERMVYVKDDAARFALTTNTTQNGDTVKVTSTKKMFYVIDDTKLSSEAGYEPYTAESASAVPWSGVTGKPTTFTPEAHTHAISDVTDLQETLTGLRQDVNAKPSKDTNTTYSLIQDSADGHKLTFKGSDGSTTTVTIPDNDHNDNTTYSLKKTGSKIQLVGSDGSTTEVTDDNTTYDLDEMINALPVGTDDPVDDDYYVSQYADGGTSNTRYYRRPVSKLWNYIKTKLATVATSGSYTDLSNKPTIGNGKVTVNQNGTTKGTFTMNQTGDTVINLTDSDTNTNTWRDVVDSLDSTRTDASLSANQGKVLNDKIDDIEIGGRNLILNSYDRYSNCSFLGSGNSFDIITTTCPDQTNGKVVRITTSASTNNNILRIRDVVQTNGTYTLSVWCKSAESTNVDNVEIDICDYGKTFTATTSWQRQTLTVTVTNQSTTYQFVDFEVPNGHSVLFWHPKLEKGNKATDWTPAPEDLVNEVSSNYLPLHGTADITTSVTDYGDTAKHIQIGFSGAGITGDDIKYIAGYTSGDGGNLSAKIKDISKDALKAWLGLGSRAYDSTSYLPLNGGTITGTLHVKPTTGSYTEGMRVYPYDGWSTIMLNGTDNTGTSGTSDKSWGLFNNDGQFYITKNGANTSPTAILSNTDGTWRANGHELITDGNIGSQNVNYANSAGSADKLAGFYTKDSSQTWGNQIGTFISGMGDSTGGSLAFRRDNPTAGQLSAIIDGYWYQNEGRFMCLDTNNYSSYALPLSGGTITGRIVKNTNGSWVGDRDRAVVYSMYPGDDSYGCVACMPTKNGSWSMGNLGGVEHLIFNYVPDANYSANKNESIRVYLRPTEGTIALTKDIPTSLPASDVYAWAKASSKPSYSWGEIGGRPTALSSFTNDSGFITGSDSRLTNARPASDVYSWAKASSKPSYTWTEISNKPDMPSISKDTPTRTNWTISSEYNCVVYRIGDFCLAVVTITGSIYPRQWLPAAKLPSGYAPKKQSSVMICGISGSDHMECMVTTDGYIKIWWSGSSTASAANICVPYYIA